jgi:hypothetical protein
VVFTAKCCFSAWLPVCPLLTKALQVNACMRTVVGDKNQSNAK